MKYNIIYADPPWKYGGSGGRCWSNADNYYPTMSFDELKAMNVKDIAADDCLLFMWVVSPELKRCIEVGEAWGFKYITVAFVWYKERANAGNYTMSSCELCLLFKKGKIPQPHVRNPGQKQFISQPVQKHSKKPDEVRERIEKMFPNCPRVELFAREKVRKWHAFGNEIDSDVMIE